ncbi:MAG: hypothetical protein EZS28_046762, partial [Streblomastix strix]
TQEQRLSGVGKAKRTTQTYAIPHPQEKHWRR